MIAAPRHSASSSSIAITASEKGHSDSEDAKGRTGAAPGSPKSTTSKPAKGLAVVPSSGGLNFTSSVDQQIK